MDSDIGFIDIDNFNYLCQQGVINSDGNINANVVKVGGVDMIMYSIYRHYVDEYRTHISQSIPGDTISMIDTDMIIELMRNGVVEVKYKVRMIEEQDGKRMFVYENKTVKIKHYYIKNMMQWYLNIQERNLKNKHENYRKKDRASIDNFFNEM